MSPLEFSKGFIYVYGGLFMRFMSSDEIRKVWLQFFKDKGHRIIESSPLIPFDDPTLLWINAGIAPLKNILMEHMYHHQRKWQTFKNVLERMILLM